MKIIGNQIISFATVAKYNIADFFSGHDSLLMSLLVFVIIDYLTGIMAAYHANFISSKIGFKGIIKKVTIFAIIAVASILDHLIVANSTIRNITIMFYISNEGISILENAAKIGIPLPEKLMQIISHFDDIDRKDDK